MQRANPDFDDFDPQRWQFEALEFWATPSEWPPDSSEYVFLARAVSTLGKISEPILWEDSDTFLRFAPMFVEGNPIDFRGPEQGYALRLLQEFRPDLGIESERVDRLSDEPLTEREWGAAFEAFDQHQRAPRIQSSKRFDVVTLWMTRLFAAGYLHAATREIIGDGKFRSVAVEDWNRDGLVSRFAFCLMSRTEPPDDTDSLAPPSFWKAVPDGLVARSSWPQYLFVSKESLSELILPPNERKSPEPLLEVGNVVEFSSASIRAKSAKAYRRFDWPIFHREVARVLDDRGDIDLAVDGLWTKAEFARVMSDWCATTWGEESIPEDSQLRKEINKAHDKWLTAQKGGA